MDAIPDDGRKAEDADIDPGANDDDETLFTRIVIAVVK